jgi:hypothetical protein
VLAADAKINGELNCRSEGSGGGLPEIEAYITARCPGNARFEVSAPQSHLCLSAAG